MWVDTDTVIMNFETRLESFLDERYDLIISKDFRGLNNGVFFIKNSNWSANLLERWWQLRYNSIIVSFGILFKNS